MKKTKLDGRTILLVEDDLETALDHQDRLADEGARLLTAYRLRSAMQLAERAKFSAAVITCARRSQESDDLCRRMEERKIPCVLLGRSMSSELGERAVVRLSADQSALPLVQTIAALLVP